MKHFFCFAVSLGLALPLLSACSSASSEDEIPNSGADTAAVEPGEVESVDSEIMAGKKPKKKTCASVGGACVGLSPSSCTGGTWADASKISCGSGLGVGCCVVSCPTFPPPAPGFCAGGKIVQIKNANGCSSPSCVMPPPPPPPQDCPELTPPSPGFCPGGSVVPRYDPSTACLIGFDCVPGATNACTGGGGTCVGLSPSSCAAGHWASATTHSCGGGIGVGCCLP